MASIIPCLVVYIANLTNLPHRECSLVIIRLVLRDVQAADVAGDETRQASEGGGGRQAGWVYQ